MKIEAKFKLTTILEKITSFYLEASFFVIFFITQTLILTLLNHFEILYVFFAMITSFILSVIFYKLVKKDIKRLPHLNVPVILTIFVISLIIIIFPHDSFGGRDEGAYSSLAIMLARNNNLSIPSYLYGAPINHEVPSNQNLGFLSTPAYIVWLATQKVLFGTEWMLKSNVILVFLGLCSLFLVSSLITKKSLAFITVLLFSTCMPFLWFSRETMTENMAFFLLWFLILSLFLFIKTKKNYFLASLFLSSWLFSFTRNEGLFIQIPVLIIFTTILLIRKIISKKKIFIISIIYISLIIFSFFVNNRLLPLNKNLNVVDTLTNLNNYMGVSSFVRLGDKISVFTFQMLSKQNLSLAIYSFPLVIILIIVSKKRVIKDKILYFCILGIISVEFLKLINPSATLEQPWMYRRYLYALLPFGYLSFSILLNKIVGQKFLVSIVCSLLLINLILSNKIITLKNNWLITKKIDKLTQSISTKDFVIIDGYVLGNYYPMSYITLHKEVRNLFKWWIEIGDWQPKEKKYQGIPYSKLFLLSDMENKSYKDFKLKKIDAIEIESRQLQANCQLNLLRNELELQTYNVARFPYLDVVKYCSKIDNDIININKKIFLYEMERNGG